MTDTIRWSPKVRQAKIARLYQSDALGVLDEELLAEVGYAFLQRCHSIRCVTGGQAECPRCGAVFPVIDPATWKPLADTAVCPTPGCGFTTTPEDWHASWRHRDLLAAKALPAVEAYIDAWGRARTPQERMLAIDRLIHTFHWDARLELPNRSFANNLIEGSLKDVVAFLDRLSAVDPAAKQHWRETVGIMWRRRGTNKK